MNNSTFKPRIKPLPGILRTANLPDKPSKPRMSKCVICKLPFVKRSMAHKACSQACAMAITAKDKAAKATKSARDDRAETKRKLDAMKTIPTLKAEAQTAFNAFIRARDAELPCICCGKFATAAALAKPGGAYDACHYRSRGSADHLRYVENNVHRGLKDCNTYGHKDYRGGLIVRIGLDAVDALECNQSGGKWTREMLIAIKLEYRKKLKQLQSTNRG